MPKKGENKSWGGFAVAGVTHTNEGMRMPRLEWIKKYVMYGAKFKLVREPDNPVDPNAIKVKHVLKSGKKITIGYVPNSGKRRLADDLAPLMDKYNWDPPVSLGRKLVAEPDNKTGMEPGTTYGLTVRYPTR